MILRFNTYITDDEEFLVSLRRERATGLLLPLFFISGATGLVYQTVWARQLNVVFGTSTFAIATVLAAFMLGLSAGGFWMARRADSVERPLQWYGWLEVVIGGYALLFPLIVQGISPLYLTFWRLFEPDPVSFGLVQLVLVGGALVIPTACMGATLPLLARFATEKLGAAGHRVGMLYGVNTFGAVVGTWFCGFILLPALGVQWNTWLCAAANIILGFAAIRLDKWVSHSVLTSKDSSSRAFERNQLFWLVCVVAAMMGFSALVYEVAWTRVLALMLGASVYAFSMMLLAFLTGIAIGGYWGGSLADRLMRIGWVHVITCLAVLEIGVGLLAFCLHYIFPELPFWYVFLFDWFGGVGTPRVQWWASAVISIVVMTPAAVLMGMAFPVAIRAVVSDKQELGNVVGWIYGANTVGGTLGAALAGFLFLPWLQMVGTIVLGVVVNVLAAVALFFFLWSKGHGRKYAIGAVMTLALGLVVVFMGTREEQGEALETRQLLMTAGMYKYVSHFDRHTRDGVMNYAVNSYELKYYREGVSSVVTVAKNRDSGNLWLANNGKVEASTTVDMPTQVMVALLPFQHVESPDEVLVIGLASGITAGAASVVPDIKTLEIVELEPAILEAARFFDEQNNYVLDNPRTKVVLNDGRNHLLLAEPGQYDIVVAEPSNPWISGVSNLFTREFWTMGKTKLKPGGVWSQWIQMYGMDDTDLRTLLATFCDVFPHVALYMTVKDADLVLLGSDHPITPNLPRMEAMYSRWQPIHDQFKSIEMGEAVSLLSSWQMSGPELREMTQDAWLNTDDNMSIEYRAPMNLHRRSTAEANVEMLLKYAKLPPAEGMDAYKWLDLSSHYLRRNDWDRSMLAAMEGLSALGQDVPNFEAAMAVARKQHGSEEWVASVMTLLRIANAILQEPDVPHWFEARWEAWRLETLRYLDGDEEEQGEGSPNRPDRSKGGDGNVPNP